MSTLGITKEQFFNDIPKWPEEIRKKDLALKYGVGISEIDSMLRRFPGSSGICEDGAKLTRCSRKELEQVIEHECEVESLKQFSRRFRWEKAES